MGKNKWADALRAVFPLFPTPSIPQSALTVEEAIHRDIEQNKRLKDIGEETVAALSPLAGALNDMARSKRQ